MSSNPIGRPRKGEGPRVPYEELDRILVFGEVVPCEDGVGTTVVYPSYRELADRYGVSHSVVCDYAKSRNVRNRRKEAQARIQAKAEHKLVEIRSDAIAYSKDDSLRIIDTYLAGFESALAERRVRFDNPADFNTMVRLKEFVMGNADSRSEVHASLSLENLQARHRQVIRVTESTAEVRGEVGKRPALAGAGGGDVGVPPPRATEDADGEASGGFSDRFSVGPIGSHEAVVGSRQETFGSPEAPVGSRPSEDDDEIDDEPRGEVGGFDPEDSDHAAPAAEVDGVGDEPEAPRSSSSSRCTPSSSSASSDTICRSTPAICGSFRDAPNGEEHHEDRTESDEDAGEEHAASEPDSLATSADEEGR